MPAAAGFLAQFFPIFLLGALFGKLMDDSGSVRAISAFMAEKMGPRHAILAVVLAGAFVTYGGVSLFVAFFVLAPMAHSLFKAANIPNHLMPAAIVLGTSTFTMSALPGTPSIQNAIPMPFFGTTPFAAPGLGVIASLIMVGYEEVSAATHEKAADDALVRERAVASHEFDPQEMGHGKRSAELPAVWAAALPLVVVVAVNLVMSFWVLPRMDVAFLQEPQWGQTTLAGVGGVWAVVVALAVAIVLVIVLNWSRLTNLRDSMDAGANASALPALSVASLVGFGGVVAALPAFAMVKAWVLGIEGGPLVSLAVSTNVLAALTGSASGGLTIALEALGSTYMQLAYELGIDPSLMHRVAVFGAGTLDSLPHNGAVVTLLAVCGSTHRKSYFDIVVVGIIGPILALVAVIVLGTGFGSF